MSEEAGHDEYLDKILRLKHVRMIVNFVKKKLKKFVFL